MCVLTIYFEVVRLMSSINLSMAFENIDIFVSTFFERVLMKSIPLDAKKISFTHQFRMALE